MPKGIFNAPPTVTDLPQKFGWRPAGWSEAAGCSRSYTYQLMAAKRLRTVKDEVELAAALGAKLQYVGKNQFDYLVEVADETTLRSLNPNHNLLRELPVRGVIVTAPGSEHDFVSRFFAPGSGIDEDPVTGSAHSALAPFWAARLGKSEMIGFQASARGGVVKVRVDGDRVHMAGQAVTVMRAEFLA